MLRDKIIVTGRRGCWGRLALETNGILSFAVYLRGEKTPALTNQNLEKEDREIDRKIDR